MSTWRDMARTVCQRIIDETRDLPTEQRDAERKRRFHDDYPFGQRQYYPYKAWLAEVSVAKGLNSQRRDPHEKRLAGLAQQREADGQGRLFEVTP